MKTQKSLLEASSLLIGTFECATFFEGTMNQLNPLDNAAGIYIHIPFCKQACHYCNFHFSTSLKYKDRMIDCIIKEIALQAHFFEDETVQSIYFGGGTPSLLSKGEIQSIIHKIEATFNVQADVEITLEANPDDIAEQNLIGWQEAGINRLSLGIQSLENEVLHWMNRAHTAEEVLASMDAIKDAGITNFSVDFIFGIPNQDEQYWQKQLAWIIEANIPHIACYNLTVEEGTALNQRIKKGVDCNVDETLSMTQFVLADQMLSSAGYEHYEISNYCKPGFISRHNSAYWKGKGYLGIGPSAHSYYKGKRSWNIANNAKYMDQIGLGNLPMEQEVLSVKDQFNEFLMLGLRTQWGIHFNDLEHYKHEGITVDNEVFENWIQKGHIVKKKEAFFLSLKGKLIADQISSSLFVI